MNISSAYSISSFGLAANSGNPVFEFQTSGKAKSTFEIISGGGPKATRAQLIDYIKKTAPDMQFLLVESNDEPHCERDAYTAQLYCQKGYYTSRLRDIGAALQFKNLNTDSKELYSFFYNHADKSGLTVKKTDQTGGGTLLEDLPWTLITVDAVRLADYMLKGRDSLTVDQAKKFMSVPAKKPVTTRKK